MAKSPFCAAFCSVYRAKQSYVSPLGSFFGSDSGSLARGAPLFLLRS